MHIVDNFIMDTVVEQRVYGENASAACERAARLLRRIENLMSFFKQGSDVRTLNESAGSGTPVPVSVETMSVLLAAKDLAEKSGGAFDITAAPLSECWRAAAARGGGVPPGEDDLSRALSSVGNDGLRLYPESGTALLTKKDAAVDLGGIAKGYAADRVIELFSDMGISSALINLGGNVKTLSAKPDGQPWLVGLQDPEKDRGVFMGVLRVINTSAVTSGGYERFYVIGKERHHHIIDPASGRPASSGLLSATVMTKSSMYADGLSTAAFVLGTERMTGLLSGYKGVEAVLVDTERHIWITPGALCLWSPAPGYEQLQVSVLK